MDADKQLMYVCNIVEFDKHYKQTCIYCYSITIFYILISFKHFFVHQVPENIGTH